MDRHLVRVPETGVGRAGKNRECNEGVRRSHETPLQIADRTVVCAGESGPFAGGRGGWFGGFGDDLLGRGDGGDRGGCGDGCGRGSWCWDWSGGRGRGGQGGEWRWESRSRGLALGKFDGPERIHLEHLDELLHGGGQDLVLLVDDGDETIDLGVGQGHGHEGLLGDLLKDGLFGDDGDSGFDFDGAFHGFDVIELHDVVDVDAAFAQDLVDGLAGGYIGFEPDEFLAVELFEADGAVAGEGVIGVGDDDAAFVAEGDDLEAAFLVGVGDEAEIDDIAEDILVDLIGALVIDVDVDGGVSAQEFADVRGEIVKTDAVDGGEADGAGDDVLDLLESGEERVVGLDDLFAVFVEQLALASESELLLAALDEERLELTFERRDLLADGGLGDAVDLSGFCEAFGFGKIAEHSKTLDLHEGNLSYGWKWEKNSE